jgi:hypothetical protein
MLVNTRGYFCGFSCDFIHFLRVVRFCFAGCRLKRVFKGFVYWELLSASELQKTWGLLLWLWRIQQLNSVAISNSGSSIKEHLKLSIIPSIYSTTFHPQFSFPSQWFSHEKCHTKPSFDESIGINFHTAHRIESHWMIHESQNNKSPSIYIWLSFETINVHNRRAKAQAETQIELIYFIISLPLALSLYSSAPSTLLSHKRWFNDLISGALFMLNFDTPWEATGAFINLKSNMNNINI